MDTYLPYFIDILQLDKSVTTMNGDGPPVKKLKGGNYEVSQGISSQRKIHYNANGSLVMASLEGNLYYFSSSAANHNKSGLLLSYTVMF